MGADFKLGNVEGGAVLTRYEGEQRKKGAEAMGIRKHNLVEEKERRGRGDGGCIAAVSIPPSCEGAVI